MKIDYLEVELNGYCNRRCSFCPNSLLSINRQQELPMADDIFYRLINDLKEDDYRGPISLSRYNENYHDANFFHTRLAYIKKHLPHCRLTNGSNGDFITAAILEESANSGLDFIRIRYYPTHEQDNDFRQYMAAFFARLCQYHTNNTHTHTHIDIKPNYIMAEWNIGSLQVQFESMYHGYYASNRGGTVMYTAYRRTVPCWSTRLFVDYNGNVMPCCHARSDVPEHAPLILGNLREQSIVEIENGKYRQMQHDLQSPDSLPDPCRRCNAMYQGGW